MSDNIILKGKMKKYDDLLLAYGTDTTKEIDENFDAFLRKIADKDCILTNYNPKDKTFDLAFMETVKDESSFAQPGDTVDVIVMPYGRDRGYSQHMGIDKIIPGSISCTNCDEHIYCTGCSYQVGKAVRYDYEPRFTYGDIFNQDCTENDTGNISGQHIVFKACNDQGEMFCPACLSYQKFDEVSNTLP